MNAFESSTSFLSCKTDFTEPSTQTTRMKKCFVCSLPPFIYSYRPPQKKSLNSFKTVGMQYYILGFHCLFILFIHICRSGTRNSNDDECDNGWMDPYIYTNIINENIHTLRLPLVQFRGAH